MEIKVIQSNREEILNNLDSMYKIISNNMKKIFDNGNNDEDNYKIWKESMIKELNVDTKRWILATHNNKLIGYMLYNIIDNKLLWDEIQIDDDHKGDHSTFYLFMKHFLNEDLSKLESVHCYTNKTNIKVQNILTNIGFTKTEEAINGYKYECDMNIFINYICNY